MFLLTRQRLFFFFFFFFFLFFDWHSFCAFDRFFETEGIAILTVLVSQYKIAIKEEPEFAGETFEERKSRVLSVTAGLTLTYVLEYSLSVWLRVTMIPFSKAHSCSFGFDSSLSEGRCWRID